MQEEIGDIIWNALVLAHICEREGKLSARQTVKDILNKIIRRKPWLAEGKKVTIEEAQNIWKEAKLREKR